MIFSRILGTGSCLPEKVLTNFDLEKMMETSHDWIVERTGIVQRKIAVDDESSVTLGSIAAKAALEQSELDPNLIDLIVVATSTPDRLFPSAACLIQDTLGIKNNCPAFDVNAACAGFNYALSVVDNFIRAGAAKHALVIGSEVMSRVIDWNDRTTAILFADGAGALVLKASDSPGIYSTSLHADGQFKDLLYVPSPLPRYGERALPYMKMLGSEVFKVAVNNLAQEVSDILDKNKMSVKEVDWFIPHQANIRIIQAVAKKINLPMEKVVLSIEQHGNTSASSIPIAMDLAVRKAGIKRGHHLLLASFGGGFVWGSALIKY